MTRGFVGLSGRTNGADVVEKVEVRVGVGTGNALV